MPHPGTARPEVLAKRASESAYSRWAPIYDLIFDLPFHPGRLAAAAAAAQAAPNEGEVLVVGVGTGLELGLLPKNLRITGIDLSAPMLKLARERVAKEALGQVKALHIMDAGALDFPDQRFDVALAPYVMSVVPAPARVLDEMWRVLRPGGQMVLMNHFSAERGLRARTEAALEKSAGWLGWHPQFPYAAVGDWIAARKDASILERRAVAPFRLFTLLRVQKATGGA
ncbi:class I SAM-dependent methyltransferase [Methylocapsa sp. S129]|uniref:class I SAM-dependent methyltransferase n=1 Tax=Methylocapsa sp. S129 TaxID=1641869 RepID=UPI00131C5F93|nr:class I SAM-dependent methyltransferase [Methylocapsa sp. S129]